MIEVLTGNGRNPGATTGISRLVVFGGGYPITVGDQIVGAIGADALVLRASRAFEQARPFGALDNPRTPAIR